MLTHVSRKKTGFTSQCGTRRRSPAISFPGRPVCSMCTGQPNPILSLFCERKKTHPHACKATKSDANTISTQEATKSTKAHSKALFSSLLIGYRAASSLAMVTDPCIPQKNKMVQKDYRDIVPSTKVPGGHRIPEIFACLVAPP